MVEAITFDYWHTLLFDTPEGLKRARELRISAMGSVLSRIGHPFSPEELNRAYDESGQRIMRVWAQDADMSARDQVIIYLDCLGVNHLDRPPEDDLAELERAYATPILQTLPQLCPGAAEMLRSLREAGVRIGLVSNTGRTPGYVLRMVLKELDILGFFDVLIFSDELKLRKPNPMIFFHALCQLRVRPHLALHVGDDLRCDVGGAKAVGMKAILLDRGHGEQKNFDIQPDGIIEDLFQLSSCLERLERSV
jgi:putative hydrolase of the HAD superfamily